MGHDGNIWYKTSVSKLRKYDSQNPSLHGNIHNYKSNESTPYESHSVNIEDNIVIPTGASGVLLKQEGGHFDVIRVLDIWDQDGYLKINDGKEFDF